MKKLLLAVIICTLALFFAPGSPAAYASDSYSYAQAVTTTAYFFKEKDLSSSLFAVPYTWYVRVIRGDGQWYYVQYAEDEGLYRAMYGYVLKDDFVLLEDPPAVTYLFKSITITYSAGDENSSLPALGEIEVEAAFYGTYYSGATAYSYVLCEGSFGYIAGANDDYPLNDLPSGEETEDPSNEGERGGSGGLVTAVIIVALVAGAIVLVYLSSRKKKSE